MLTWWYRSDGTNFEGRHQKAAANKEPWNKRFFLDLVMSPNENEQMCFLSISIGYDASFIASF